MNTIERFIAYAQRDARVIEEIRQTQFVLQLVKLAEIGLDGASVKDVLTREIDRLRYVTRMMGGSDDDYLPWTPPDE